MAARQVLAIAQKHQVTVAYLKKNNCFLMAF